MGRKALSCTIEEIKPDQFRLYDAIPNRFEVESVFQVQAIKVGLDGFRLVERKVSEPFTRDFFEQNQDNPTCWATRFDIQKWGIFLAKGDEGEVIGGAAVAIDSPVYPMDKFQREDLAVLWDIRVHPDHRRKGVGTQLFQHAVDWARARGYGQLGIETDSSNVAACRFYASQGCEIGAIHRFGYVGVPEVAQYAMLLWYLDL